MARLPDDVIERIKSEISLLRLVESQGYQPKKQGKDYSIRCPFHEGDNTPSLIISPKSNLYHCFGCAAAGSVIDWVMKTQGVSFRFACELLQKDLGLIADSGTRTVRQNTTTKLAAPLSIDADKQTALRQVIDYYHQTLKQSPEALAYLESRGLKSAELIDTFQLGHANRTLAYRLPEKNRKAGAELRGKLQDIGLLRKSGHEHFNGCLVVPIMDENGVITELYGRKLNDNLRPGTAYHLYLPGPHQGVWNAGALKASDEIILCEALIDAMTFWVHGFRNVTASYGTGGFTDDHLSAFKRHGIKRVLIAYDRDESGNRAAGELAKKLATEGIDCFRLLLPKGMDVNDYALQVTPAAKSLGLAIRQAEWIPNTLPSDAGQALGEGRAPLRQLDTEMQSSSPTDVIDTDAGEVIFEAPEIPPALAALPEPAASPMPEPESPVEAEVSEHETVINLGDRRYRIRGLHKNLSYDQLKVNVLVSRGEHFHVDTLELYNARQRGVYLKQAGLELGVNEEVIKKDLGQVLLKLEALQERQIKGELTLEKKAASMSETEEREALDLLKDKRLLHRILEDFDRAGVVGEETNKLVGYLAGVSRKLDKPLAVIIQSSSAAGKSSLMDAVLAMMPEEERVQYSAMTGQSLFYMGETNLKHKILAIAEEEGAEHASYALKLLQSEGEITIASTGKDATTGNLTTQEYRVEGPVMLFLTTTAIDIDEELLNRCIVLSVNENREQTEAIHARQRFEETLEGLLAGEEKQHLIRLHRNAQRLLRPLKVVNPFAGELTFLNDKTRTRRDHKKYLTLIRAIALLHQYQRSVKTVSHQDRPVSYVEVSLSDIETANRLANEVLGRTLDELPPQTRRLLSLIRGMVTSACQQQKIEQKDFRFSRRDIRAVTGWSDNQLKVHCRRLEELEYLLIHRGGRGQSMEYELLFSGDVTSHRPQLMGLIDIDTLKTKAPTCGYDDKKLEANPNRLAPSCPQVGAKLVPGGGGENAEKPITTDLNGDNTANPEKNAIREKLPPSYRTHTHPSAAEEVSP